MNLPSVPTDNLYKFFALTGIAFLILSILYSEIKTQELRDEVTLLNGEINELNHEKIPLREQEKEIKKRIDQLDKICNCKIKSVINDSMIIRPVVTKGPKEIMEINNEIDSLIDARNELISETNFKGIEISTKRELVTNKENNLSELNAIMNGLLPSMILLSFVGFIFWYNQTQKYQDNLLREQYEQLKKFENCQSCGIHFTNIDSYNILTPAERLKVKYCASCFQEDKFTEPDITLSEMKKRVKARCKEIGFGKLSTFIYVNRISNLERWITKFTWK